jgi:cytochrome P450
MLPAFHGERMLAYADAMEEATEREIAGWRAGSEVNLHAAMQSITLDVIMRAVFGVAEDRRERLRRSLVEMLAATRSPLSIGITLPAVSRLPRFRRVADMIADANRLLAAEVAAHRADPRLQEREDILSMLLLARDEDGDGMDDAEIRDQLMTLLVAGHETTATGLAWTFDLLFRNPGALARARAEAAGDDHAYLDAVVEEALRLRPVIPFVGRELRVASELGGYELPVGTNVMPSIYLTHTRADLFPEPYAFRPERFGEAKPETYSWIPFGGGTRRCLGAAFAQMEMRVVLRTVLRQVELEPARDEPERFVRRNVTLSPAHGTPARVVARWPGERGGRALAAGPR